MTKMDEAISRLTETQINMMYVHHSLQEDGRAILHCNSLL